MEKAYDGSLIYCPKCKSPNTFTETLKNGYLGSHICDGCGFINHYPAGITLYTRCVYKETCVCGKELIALTQQDNFPEYQTQVGIVCGCGEVVEFSLPVN